MTMDITTIGIAVDSSPVDTAGAALDRMVVAGDRATAATARLAKASADGARSMAGSLAPAAAKGAVAFKSVADAAAALGPAAAQQIAGLAAELGTVQRVAAATAGSLTAAGQSWRQFVGQRMGPVMGELSAQGVPHKEAHTQAIRQIAQEWKVYKDTATAAQAAVSAQSAAAGAALASTANQAASTARALDGMASAAERGSRRGAGAASGLTEIATEATRAKGAVTDLSKATTSLGASAFVDFDKVTTSLGAAAAKASEAAREVHQLRTETAQLGALAGATTSLGARVGPASPPPPPSNLREAIERRGLPTIDPRLAGGAAAATALAGAAGKATGQMDALGKSTKLAAWQTQQLGFQVHDFFVQIASGGNPLTALVQQGSQLSGTFGGAGNALRALTSLITPMTVAIGAGAATVGALALALAHAESEARGLATVQAQLSGTGRDGLFSTGELRGFIAELSRAPGVTRETATAIVSELSRVHQIGGGIFKDLAGLTADYAKATAQEIPQAGRELGKAFADPAKGAQLLEERLGKLTSGQILLVERLARTGDTVGAQRALFDALQSSVKGLADNAMTPLQRSVNDLGNSWAGAMDRLSQSDGLRAINTLLARTVELVDFLVKNTDKIGGLGNIGVSMIPGVGAPAAIGSVLADRARSLFGASKNPVSAGRVTDLSGSARAGAAATPGAAGAANPDDEIKQALGAAKAYSSQAAQLAELSQERKRFSAALQQSIALYGKESEQAKRLRDAIGGVDERMAAVRKRGAGGGAREGQQVLDAQLEQRLKAGRDALDAEREGLAFHQRYLQGAYQAGQVSLREFYDEQRVAIERGVAAKLAELDKEREAVEKHLADTIRTSPKDLSAQERDRTRLQDIAAQAEKARTAGAREVVLSDQQKAEALRQLADQVANYRANLLQLQGDEAGAAKVRAEQAIEQGRRLASQSQDTASAITPQEQAAERTAVQQVLALNQAKLATSVVNQRLQIEEDRIALAMQRGAISETEAMGQVGAARTRAVAELEKVVVAQEAVAASRPKDYQLQIDTSRARLELERLKAELDPLKDKFDDILKDGTSNLLTDLMGGKKPLDALKGALNTVAGNINRMVSEQITQSLFAKDGMLGGAGGFLADLFGGKDRAAKGAAGAAPAIDTSGLTSSLTALQTAGIDPSTAALGRFQTALDGATSSVGGTNLQPLPAGSDLPPLADGTGSTGDFARFDRRAGAQASIVEGEWNAMGRAARGAADANSTAATAALQLAQAASRGGGALSLLPQIVQMIISAAGSSSGGSSGGGMFGNLLGSLFGGGSAGSSFAAGGSAGAGFGTGSMFGNMDIGLFLHRGGIVGASGDRRPIPRGVFADAGRYHGGGTVGGAGTAGLKAHEVPAILMGGPRGKREEVLTASDPRHRDNLNPRTATALRIPRYHSGGIAGQRPDVLLPAQGVRYLTGPDAGESGGKDGKGGSAGDVFHLNVTVPMPQGGSRSTAMQYGHAAGRQIQRALVHNGR